MNTEEKIKLKMRVRFAPSPTGLLHIGSIRTALYNFLLARKNHGVFILRIEDTDRERYVDGAVEYIIQSFERLGLRFDEGPGVDGAYGPYIQSQRLDLYKKHAQQLLEKGFAYKDNGAIRFKTTKEGTTTWHDLIGNKDITFNNKTQEDFIILKSDGFPTYNFANVIDDHYMEISHVIRGPEFIPSTPKHLMVYKAFGWNPPFFGHVPMILGPDRSKLSKRHGAKPVLDFRDEGYLPEALLNFMALLGWTPPSGKEILSLEEMIDEFDIDDVNVASPIFDIQKLDWMNGEYIRKMSDEELTQRLQEFLVDHPEKDKIAPLVPLIKERIKKLSDFIPLTYFIFEKPEYDISVFNQLKLQSVDVKEVLHKMYDTLQSLPSPWKKEDFETSLQELARSLEMGNRDFFQLLRVAVSGQLVTPPLYETIKVMGEKEALDRIIWVADNYPNF